MPRCIVEVPCPMTQVGEVLAHPNQVGAPVQDPPCTLDGLLQTTCRQQDICLRNPHGDRLFSLRGNGPYAGERVFHTACPEELPRVLERLFNGHRHLAARNCFGTDSMSGGRIARSLSPSCACKVQV